MYNDEKTRRKVLQLSAASLASLGAVSGIAAGGSGESVSDFDPDDPEEVAAAAEKLRNADKSTIKSAFRAMNEEQHAALRSALTSVETVLTYTEEVKQEESADWSVRLEGQAVSGRSSERTTQVGGEGQAATSSDVTTTADWTFERATYSYRSYSSLDGMLLYEFSHQATWEYDGTAVRNVSNKHAAATHHPLWHWKGLIDEDLTVYSDWFESYMQGKFSYCEPLGFGCVKTDNPYIFVHGYDDGSHVGWSRG